MNKNATPIILLILALGIYFTFTRSKVETLKSIKNVNAGYQEAINNSEKLIKTRDSILKAFNEISENDRQRLEKMLPNNIDNVRLTLDVKSIGLGRGLLLKNVKTNAPNINTSIVPTNNTTSNTSNSIGSNSGSMGRTPMSVTLPSNFDTVTLSFNVTTDYKTFMELLNDLETSLRIIDISKITLTANDTNLYDYGVEIKTYWLKQ